MASTLIFVISFRTMIRGMILTSAQSLFKFIVAKQNRFHNG